MKPIVKPSLTLSQVLHAPVQNTWAFFTVFTTCILAIAALRFAPQSGESEALLRSGATSAQARQIPLPPPPQSSLVGTDNLSSAPFPLGEFYVGVIVESIDPALIAQLKLECGIVVRHTVPNSPAEKAGVKPNDVLVRAGDAALVQVCNLGAAVNKAKETEIALDLVREGTPLKLTMTPCKRPAQMWMPPNAQTAEVGGPNSTQGAGNWVYANPTGGSDTGRNDTQREKLEALEKELAKAREEIERLRADLKKLDGKK